MDLGELLTILHNSDSSVATLYVRYRVWEDRTLGREAFLSAFEAPVTHREPHDAVQTPHETVSCLEVWRAAQCIRADQVGDQTRHLSPRDFMLVCHPWRLSSALRLDVVGETVRRDRRVVRVAATPRPSRSAKQLLSDAARDLAGFAPGATHYDLEIDADLGIVMNVCARFRDCRFYEITLQDLQLESVVNALL